MGKSTHTLGLRMNDVGTLFVNTREGFSTVARAINLLSDKLDEVIRSHNEVNRRLEVIENGLNKKEGEWEA